MLFVKKTFTISSLLLVAGLAVQAQQKPYSWDNLPQIAEPVFKKDTINILSFGAKADGITLNTKAINDAITACSNKGGGVVLVPQGFWLTGPIVFKSNVNLSLHRAALLQFTDDKSQYPLVKGNYEGKPAMRNQSPISGENLENIAITGKGIVDGNGNVWRAIGKDRLTEEEWSTRVAKGGIVSENGKSWYPSESYLKGLKTPNATSLDPEKPMAEYESMKDFFRPNMVVFTNCKKVLLQDATFQNSPAWCLHTLICEDLTLQNVTVENPWNAQNGDAADIESCRNVLIEGCVFDAGDDGICIKSGRDAEGRKRGKPTENVIVRNNIVYRGHGGFVIGSEMSGGARNIFVSDCTFIGTDIGLRFKTTRGRGGVVENIFIKNIAMRDILHQAILFDMYYMGNSPSSNESINDVAAVPVSEATPAFRNFHVSNVVCNGAEKGLMLRGLPEMNIKDITLDNLTFKTNKGIEIIEAQNISLSNVHIDSKETDPLVYVGNGSNITLNHITYPAANTLLKVAGKKSAKIKLLKTDTKTAEAATLINDGAAKSALQIVK